MAAGNGLPVPTRARPSVHASTSDGIASQLRSRVRQRQHDRAGNLVGLGADHSLGEQAGMPGDTDQSVGRDLADDSEQRNSGRRSSAMPATESHVLTIVRLEILRVHRGDRAAGRRGRPASSDGGPPSIASPAETRALVAWRAMPIPADPAPAITTRSSVSGVPVIRIPPTIAATPTAAVP